jgi:hypothetical protein
MQKKPNTNSGTGADAVCENTDIDDGGVPVEKKNVGGVKIAGGPGLEPGAALGSGRPTRFQASKEKNRFLSPQNGLLQQDTDALHDVEDATIVDSLVTSWD